MKASRFVITWVAALYASAVTASATELKFTVAFQSFTVQATGLYRIVAFGAEGGDSPVSGVGPAAPCGLGAEIGGDFHLMAGEVLQIAAGGAGHAGGLGSFGARSGGGGGGGSFVVGPGGLALVIAGGGGGASALGIGLGGEAGTAGGDGSGNPGSGGTGGSGGRGSGNNTGGGGGGGFNSPGGSSIVAGGGASFCGRPGRWPGRARSLLRSGRLRWWRRWLRHRWRLKQP